MAKGTTASDKPTRAPRATGLDEARRTKAGRQGTPERHAAGHNQGTRTGAKQQQPPGAANPGRAHNPHQTTAQEQVPGNPQPTNHSPEPGSWGTSRQSRPTHTPQHPSQEWRGAAKNQSRNTHTGRAHPSQEWRGTSGARTQTQTHPTPQVGVAGRSRNPSPSTHTHKAHPSHQWRGTSRARTQTHKHPNIPARSDGAQPQAEPRRRRPHRTPQPGVAGYKRSAPTNTHTHSPPPQPGVAGRSRNRSPSTHTRTAHTSQEWRGTTRARSQTHTHPDTPARSGEAQPKPDPRHTHPHRRPEPGVAGYKRGAPTNTHTPQYPSQEWRGAAETRAQAHTPTPHAPVRSGGVQAGRAPEHTHTPTSKPGVAERSRNSSRGTDTHTADPSQEWRGTSGARPQTHTHPNTPARSGRAQPKPEPKHTHARRTPEPGGAGYERGAPTIAQPPQHSSREWRGAAASRAQAHTSTPHTPARSDGVQAERAHKHTHTPTPQPGVAGRSPNPSPRPHSHAAHPRHEWRGTSGARPQAHTHHHGPARSGGAQPQPEPRHTHPHRTPQPGVAGYKQSAPPNTHTPQHPSQEWRGAAKTRAQAHTPTPQTPARSGGIRAERAHEHKHTQHPSQEWRGAAKTRARTRTPAPHTRARSGGVQADRAHKHTHSPTPKPSSGGAQPKPEPEHTHPRCMPQPGVAGYKRSVYTRTHTPQHPSKEWPGAAKSRTQAHTPTPHTSARSGRVQAERTHKRTHTPTRPPGVAGRNRNPSPTTTQSQTQAPRNSRKPSVHTPGTEAARAMQVTRPNEIRSTGVRLHPKACDALGLEAKRATPKHLRTPAPRRCMHALGTGYARKSSEPLGFRSTEGTCASTGAHPPGMTSSHAGGDQPSRCCPGPLCWGPPVRCSRM